MEETLEINSNEDVPQLTNFQDGKMTADGLLCEDGTLIPRAKKEPRPGLTEEDEITISRWVADYKRDHEHMDVGLINMFCTWATTTTTTTTTYTTLPYTHTHTLSSCLAMS